MKVNPFSDALDFLLGRTPDHGLSGPFVAWLLTLGFLALLGAAFWIAWRNWQDDPRQHTSTHLWTGFMRFMIGCMWFQGSLWKLPLPVSGGLQFWTSEEATHAAFGFHRWIVSNILLPFLAIFDPLVYMTELSLAIAFILGFCVRPFALLGILFTIQLWLGLYRHPGEWPWEYVFLMFTMGFFYLTDAGRSLGLDAILARNPPALLKGDGTLARLYRRVA